MYLYIKYSYVYQYELFQVYALCKCAKRQRGSRRGRGSRTTFSGLLEREDTRSYQALHSSGVESCWRLKGAFIDLRTPIRFLILPVAAQILCGYVMPCRISLHGRIRVCRDPIARLEQMSIYFYPITTVFMYGTFHI